MKDINEECFWDGVGFSQLAIRKSEQIIFIFFVQDIAIVH